VGGGCCGDAQEDETMKKVIPAENKKQKAKPYLGDLKSHAHELKAEDHREKLASAIEALQMLLIDEKPYLADDQTHTLVEKLLRTMSSLWIRIELNK
jgi:hypothetical protein